MRTGFWTLFGVIVLAMLSVGCKGKAEEGPGSLTYEGSATISDNILPEAVPAFEKKTGHKVSKIGDAGSGKGFEAAMSGNADVGGLSRELHDDERAQKPYHRVIGYDALAVFLHESNPVTALSKDQLKGIFTGTIKDWSELGATPGPIEPTTEFLDQGRATTEVFHKVALDEAKFGAVTQVDQPSDCVAHVKDHPNAISYAALAFATDGVKSIAVDDVEPTLENVQSGAYLLSRPLVLVSKETPKGAVKDFFDFMLSDEGQAFVGKKFVPVAQ